MMDVKLHLLNLVQGREQLVVICLAKKFLFIDPGGCMTTIFQNPNIRTRIEEP
jgi:hypothetical protein